MPRSFIISYLFKAEQIDDEGVEEFAVECLTEFREHLIEGESVELLSVVEQEAEHVSSRESYSS